MAITSLATKADEGMWVLHKMDSRTHQVMQQLGLKLSPQELYDTQSGTSLKDAVVDFGDFCSGVVVSRDGLVFTNHHCGFGAIQALSTTGDDILKNGFVARNHAEERPAEGLSVFFLQQTDDVTETVKARLQEAAKAQPELTRQELASRLTNEVMDSLQAEYKTMYPNREVRVQSFCGGSQFYVSIYKEYKDIRLVFTPTQTLGKFGGDTDNWMWPRQTCDFSVFRIYADPNTNGPADYNEKNVPYKPETWAQVSLQGYREGDFSMTIGYPGSTNRYLSSFGIRERRDASNAPMAQVRGVKQQVMWKHMTADEAVRIKYDSKYAQSSNYWKNSLGMNKCIDSVNLIGQKETFEQRIRLYQDSTGYLKGQLDLNLMKHLYNERFEYIRALTYFRETFGSRANELTARALKVHNGMEVKGPKNKKKKQYVEFEDNSDVWDAATEKEMLAVMLKNYREKVDARFLPQFYNTIDNKFGGNYALYVEHVWNNSVLMKPNQKIYINKKSFYKDCGVEMGLDLTNVFNNIVEPIKATIDSIDQQEKFLCDVKLRMEMDQPHYSDANFTMRLSYGQVGGFLLDGKPSGYYTTAESIVKKMKQAETIKDYYAEPIMHSLLSASNFGKYTDNTTGKMQLCFLTNNDITGGNSGSPMFNGKGELIGLAFDGNWDSLASDILFDRQLARCIGVDIRYVLYMMDKWGNTERLIKEINAK